MVELFNAYNGTPEGEEPSTVVGGNEQEKTARAKFDKIFTDHGGTALDLSTSGNGESYWASTEDNSSESYAIYGCNVRFSKFLVNMGDGQCKKTGTQRFIRCVKAIGDYKPGPEPIEVSLTLDKKSVELENTANSEESVIVTITNGTLTSATPEDNTWCSAEVQGNTVVIKALSENTETNPRSTQVTVNVSGFDGKGYSDVITVTQKAAEAVTPPDEPEVPEYKVGEYYEDNDTKGVIFWVSEDGKTAKIVSLTRSETTLAWSTEAKAYGVEDEDNGYENTKKLRDANDGNVPALEFCENGTTFDDATNKTPAQISENEKEARAAFDKVLEDHGGTKLNTDADSSNGDQYWGSTELSAEYGSYIRVGKRYIGAQADTPKKDNATKRYIRCIKQIGVF